MSLRAGALLLAAALLATPALASERAGVLRLRAERLAAAGDCDAAMPLLERALSLDPGEARAALVAGQCEIQRKRYPAAAARLERARHLAPELHEVDLYLGIARFHLGDLDGAEAAFGDVAPAAADRPEYALYSGLLKLRRAEAREAALALDRARASAPDLVEPVASYYAGLAWALAEERQRALEMLKSVIARAPESAWAAEAERAVARLEGRDGKRVAWFTAASGLEYDDNVILRSDAVRGVFQPEEVGRGHDVRAVWSMEAGSELLRWGDFLAGVRASYSGSAHQDLSEFNDQYPTLSLWLDRRFGEATTARLQYDVGYAWFDGDPFLFGQSLTPALYHDWGAAGVTQLFAGLDRANYLFGNQDDPRTPGRNEESVRNRDGNGLRVGFEHALPLPVADARLRAGYVFHRYSARGREYSYQAHEVRLGASGRLPLELSLDASLSAAYKPYRHASSFFVTTPERRHRSDDVWRVEVSLERPVGERVSAGLRYAFLQNHSNTDVFDYDREVLGAFLTVRFHR